METIPAKRAFLIMSPAASGSRLVTRIFMKAGCDGEDGHIQRWDTEPFDSPLLVYRVAHIDLVDWEVLLSRLNGYMIIPIIITRDWGCMARSEVRGGCAESITAAYQHIRNMYNKILTFFAERYPYIFLSYEELILRGDKVINRILEDYGFNPIHIEITDENAKYYKG